MRTNVMRAVTMAMGLATALAAATVGASADDGVIGIKGIAKPNLTALALSSQTIGTAGPLTRIHLGDELSCQVEHANFGGGGQIYHASYKPGDCGTFLVVDKQLFGPEFGSHAGTATPWWTPPPGYTPYTRVSQTQPTGAGTLSNPYIVTTVVDAGTTGIRLTRIDTYVNGRSNYRSDVVVTNTSGTTRTVRLYHGLDCYLSGNDAGTGLAVTNPSAQTSWVGCASNNRIERLMSLTAGNGHYEDSYWAVWNKIDSKAALPNTVVAPVHDNAIAIDWSVTLPHNGSVIRSFLTDFFSSPVVVSPPPLPDSYVRAAVLVRTDEGTTPSGYVDVALSVGEQTQRLSARIPTGGSSS